MGEITNFGPRKSKALVDRADFLRRALVPLDQIEPELHREYLVKGWLDPGAFSVMYGESNVGKTFLALDLAVHIAAGEPWHGKRVSEPRPVVYVASEGGRGVVNRLDAIWREKGHLARAAARNFFLLPVTVDLHGRADVPALVEMVQGMEEKPAFIVIDTLARSMGSGDENTPGDMGRYIDSVGTLSRATGAHVMVIHHSGKDKTKGARGHNSLKGSVDTEIALEAEGEIITATAEKQRDMPKGKTFAYRLKGVHLGDDQDGDPITSCVVEPAEATETKRGPKITGQALVALQALGEALAEHGQAMADTARFPANRRVVSLDQWRAWCVRMDMAETPGATKTAFSRVKVTLQNLGAVCFLDGYVWRVSE